MDTVLNLAALVVASFGAGLLCGIVFFGAKRR